MTLVTTAPTITKIINYDRLLPHSEILSAKYQTNSPYPHIVLEDFLDVHLAMRLFEEFPQVQKKGWINYLHYNEKKFGKNDFAGVSNSITTALQELNSPAFMSFLKQLTGIQDLFPDPTFEGGGLHQTLRNGFLNIHADFTVHPHHYNWRRRVNVLVYLNPYWKEEYGGHLELWDSKMRRCEHKILPIFNRAVIFNTDVDSFHGVPDPLNCPPEESRKSLALYYFTHDANAAVRATNYKARPGDGLKRIFIRADKYVLRLYDWVKRKAGLRDDFASKWLGKFERFKNKLHL